MDSVKTDLLTLLLETEAIKFGRFETKSGRTSPYFINLGQIADGQSILKLAGYYAQAIKENFGSQVDNIFGPAYKGISLAVASSIVWQQTKSGKALTFTFDRKEAKSHGEGGSLVGYSYKGGEKVVIVEDVLTRGTALTQAIPLITERGAQVCGVVIAVDRQEVGFAGQIAKQEIETTYGIPVVALLNWQEIVNELASHDYLGKRWIDAALLVEIEAYRREWSET